MSRSITRRCCSRILTVMGIRLTASTVFVCRCRIFSTMPYAPRPKSQIFSRLSASMSKVWSPIWMVARESRLRGGTLRIIRRLIKDGSRSRKTRTSVCNLHCRLWLFGDGNGHWARTFGHGVWVVWSVLGTGLLAPRSSGGFVAPILWMAELNSSIFTTFGQIRAVRGRQNSVGGACFGLVPSSAFRTFRTLRLSRIPFNRFSFYSLFKLFSLLYRKEFPRNEKKEHKTEPVLPI